jgi:hypothetical protein
MEGGAKPWRENGMALLAGACPYKDLFLHEIIRELCGTGKEKNVRENASEIFRLEPPATPDSTLADFYSRGQGQE